MATSSMPKKTKTTKRNATVTVAVKLNSEVSATRAGRLWKQIVMKGIEAVRSDRDDPMSREMVADMIAANPRIVFNN